METFFLSSFFYETASPSFQYLTFFSWGEEVVRGRKGGDEPEGYPQLCSHLIRHNITAAKYVLQHMLSCVNASLLKGRGR